MPPNFDISTPVRIYISIEISSSFQNIYVNLSSLLLCHITTHHKKMNCLVQWNLFQCNTKKFNLFPPSFHTATTLFVIRSLKKACSTTRFKKKSLPFIKKKIVYYRRGFVIDAMFWWIPNLYVWKQHENFSRTIATKEFPLLVTIICWKISEYPLD